MENISNNNSSMDYYSKKNPFYYHHSLRKSSLILLLLFIAGFFFFVSFLSSSSSKSLLSYQLFQCPNFPRHNQTATATLWAPKDELESTLEKASMKNKTVIIAVVNKAYVEGKEVPNMLDLFLEGFWAGDGTRELLNHLMVVAVDQTAYERCLFRGLHCYKHVTDGVDFMGEKVYMSDDFINMMWSRTLLLGDILKRGYNFIFTDTDVIWLRNPFKVLTTNKTDDFDIQFSTDMYNGNSSSLHNPINTGFYFVKSNNKTINLFEKWYSLKNSSKGLKEQDVIQNLTWQGVLTDLGIKAQFLDTRFFSGFCQVSWDMWSVVTVHANCCRFITAKVADLHQVLSDWAHFNVIPNNEKKLFKWSPHSECIKSWLPNVANHTNKT